jgi:hypothetical protein
MSLYCKDGIYMSKGLGEDEDSSKIGCILVLLFSSLFSVFRIYDTESSQG